MQTQSAQTQKPKMSLVDSVFNEAERLYNAGELKNAESLCHIMLNNNDREVRALNLLGVILSNTDRNNEAVQCFEKSATIKPDDPQLLHKLAVCYKLTGQFDKSMSSCNRAVQLDKNNKTYIRYFASLVQSIQFHKYSESADDTLCLCMNEPSIMHQKLMHPWKSLLESKENLKNFWSLEKIKTYKTFKSKITEEDLRALTNSKLFLEGLKRIIVTGQDYERLITFLRRYILEHADDQSFKEFFPLVVGVAQQGFLNEYVYNFETAEINKIKKLDHLNLLHIPILASYELLYKLDDAEEMSGKLHRSHRPELEELAKQQIDEPLYELKIAKTMPQLNPIKNDVSNAVRDQYEENPYPRWLNLDIYSQTKKQKEASRGKKILIGGCGTGRESINLATLFPNADVLAVDLSLTSLAYGQRKAEEYGVKNIKYMHADILDLHMLDEKFDLIASAGVLHHMEEPRKGFEQFVNLLNPNGVLKIGVYSDLGRQAVIRCREWIAENGWEPTTENVRKFRTSILDLPDDDPLKEIATWKSFYSLSNCRDLVFHVQEHRFTMPKLEALFNDLSLELIGFILQNKSLRATYKELYPDDPHLVNFKNWHEYETKNPGTFSLMYNFWLGKKGEYVSGQYPEWVKIALGDAIY